MATPAATLVLLVVASSSSGGGELLDWKVTRPAPVGSGIRLNATGVAWRSYADDQGIARPTTFSWGDGYPTASATTVQCGLFTDGKANTDGFLATVALATAAQEVRAYVGSYDSTAMINASLLDDTGAVIATEARLVPSGGKQANGVGNAELRVRWSSSAKPALVSIRWSPVSGGGNLQFNALVVSSKGSSPCVSQLCTAIEACNAASTGGNCTDVNLGASDVIDWLHTGSAAAPAPPPAPPRGCSVPKILAGGGVKAGLQLAGPVDANATVGWLAAMRRGGARAWPS